MPKPPSGNPNPHQARDKVIKNRASVPRRERWLVRQALDRLHLRYWEAVTIWNPMFTGLRTRKEGGWQWLDFVIRTPYGAGAVLMDSRYSNSRPHLFEKRALAEKKAFLESRNLPYIVLTRDKSLEEYTIILEIWLRKEKRKHEKQIR